MKNLLLPCLVLASSASPILAGAQQLDCYTEEAEVQSTPASSNGTLDLDGDTLILGATGYGDNGAASFFERQGAGWSQQAFLEPNTFEFGAEFGVSVAIDGDTAVVGAWQGYWNAFGPRGEAFVFTRSGSTWAQTQVLGDVNLLEWSFYGASVDVSGDTLVVGADWAGRVYVYVWDGATWVERDVIHSPAGGLFGGSVSLDRGNPSTLVVGAPRVTVGSHQNNGAAYVYVGNGSSWSYVQRVSIPPHAPDRNVGSDVAVSGDRLIVGASNASNGSVRSGIAQALRWDGSIFVPEATLMAPDGEVDDAFGIEVALDGARAVIGASGEEDELGNRGGAHVFFREGTTWSESQRLVPADHHPSFPYLGLDVAISGERVLTTGNEGGLVFEPKGRLGLAYCFCGNPPCANPDVDAGCANSTGDGATLEAQGASDLRDVDLVAKGVPPKKVGIFFEGTNAIQIPFGDGQLCAGGQIVRLRPGPVQASADGVAIWGPCEGGPTIQSITGVLPGQTRRYQFWYRDPMGPCGSGFNTTNGLEISW